MFLIGTKDRTPRDCPVGATEATRTMSARGPQRRDFVEKAAPEPRREPVVARRRGLLSGPLAKVHRRQMPLDRSPHMVARPPHMDTVLL